MKRYLVTGGAGFIGSAISNKLSDSGNFVRVLDNQFRGAEKSVKKNPNVEFIQADIRNEKDVVKACKNIDSIIHLAFINGTKYFYEKPDLVLEVGVKGMLSVLEGGKVNNVKELFLASSSEVYQTPQIIPTPETVAYSIPDPLNPRYSYAGGKIISEMLGIYMGGKIFKKTVIFRPHNVYGPNMGAEHVIPELISKIISLKKTNKNNIGLPIQGKGLSTRAFIYIDDFVDGVMLLLKKGKNQEIYNIGTENEIQIKELIDMLSKVSDTNIKIIPGVLPKGGTKRRCPDVSKLSSLGFESKTGLFEGLQKTFLWYNAHH